MAENRSLSINASPCEDEFGSWSISANFLYTISRAGNIIPLVPNNAEILL